MKPDLKLSLLAAACVVVLSAVRVVVADDTDTIEMCRSDQFSTGGAMGKHMTVDDHMTMTSSWPETAADAKRGEEILATMRRAPTAYQNSEAAIAAGYIPYMPSVPQDVYHFASRAYTGDEYRGDVNIERPGALLYERRFFGGYKLVGAMYSAPPDYTLDQLNAIVPLGLTHWHAHTNICLPAGVTEQDVMDGNIQRHFRSSLLGTPEGFDADPAMRMRLGYLADRRFGFTGTISTESDCEAVGGNFYPQIFGWMVHVYPFQSDDLKVAFSSRRGATLAGRLEIATRHICPRSRAS